MTFNHQEKRAIIYMCNKLVHADDKFHRGERIALIQLKHTIGFDTDDFKNAEEMVEEEVLLTLRRMTQEKKQAFSKILNDIAISDNHLHLKEIMLIADTFKRIGFDQEIV